MPEETFEATDLPKPIDLLFAALAVLLIVLGAVLIVANPTERPAPRVPVITPAQLIVRQLADTREG
jgi:hypothetical protein